MARKRSPERDKAFEIWKDSGGGEMSLKDIAEQLDMPEGTVRGWKSKDQWERKLNGTLRMEKRNVPPKARERSAKKIQLVFNEDAESKLTEKMRLFCLYYVKCFNATQAAIQAGYSKDTAHVIGWENLRKPRIAAEIKRLKGRMAEELFIDAMDVLETYAKIAFTDPTDYVTFGQKEVPVMGPFGPLYEGKGKSKKPITKIINFVDFKESAIVDGAVISEVSQGRDGAKIKFADKMKALEKLEKYFDLLPDQHKRKVEEERLKLDRERLELERSKATGDIMQEADDGFMSALEGTVGGAWDGFNDELTEEGQDGDGGDGQDNQGKGNQGQDDQDGEDVQGKNAQGEAD